MLLEAKLLSKVVIDKDFWTLAQFNIKEDDFSSYVDIYTYVKDFVKEYGQTPDYRNILERFPKFDFQTEVYDTFPYLCKALKKHNAKMRIIDTLQNKLNKQYKENDIDAFIEWLGDEVSTARNVLNASASMGSNYANNGKERMKRYKEAKDVGSGIFIKTPYETLNEYLDGGFELGDYVLLQAFSNVGKSWIASHIGVNAWANGHGVLHYSPELSKAQQENRNDTLLGNFNNVAMRNGELNNEERYFEFLEQFQDNDTPYIIKTMEDIDELSVQTIQADLELHKNDNIKVLIIDGFNLMKHGNGKLDRNAMSQTSRQLRQLFSKYSVVGIVVHQVNAAEQKENHKKGKDEEGASPIPRPASIFGYSETIAVVQDACTILSYDAVDGMGEIFIAKARGTGKEKSVSLNVNYNLGKITEASAVNHF